MLFHHHHLHPRRTSGQDAFDVLQGRAAITILRPCLTHKPVMIVGAIVQRPHPRNGHSVLPL